MMDTVTYIQDYYNEIHANYSDPRTRDWPLVKSPIPTLCIVVAYVIFVKIIGPKMMENRKPFELKSVMIVYNGLQAFIAFYLFTNASIYGWFSRYNWICQPVVVDHPDEAYMLTLGWYFYLVRFLEFSDTIFFILRKKFNQISTLHVVHHAIVPLLFWAGETFVPAGHYTIAAYLNAFVHTFMYTYYLLSALGPQYSRFVWWKIYMTKLQLAQFIFVLFHTIYTLFSSCPVPKMFAYIIMFQAILFFAMFLNFYNKNNGTNGSKKPLQEKTQDHLTNGINEESLKNVRSRKIIRIHSD